MDSSPLPFIFPLYSLDKTSNSKRYSWAWFMQDGPWFCLVQMLFIYSILLVHAFFGNDYIVHSAHLTPQMYRQCQIISLPWRSLDASGHSTYWHVEGCWAVAITVTTATHLTTVPHPFIWIWCCFRHGQVFILLNWLTQGTTTQRQTQCLVQNTMVLTNLAQMQTK